MPVIFTNGCFDLLHRGHLELLKFCKSLGGKVVVGLNSDQCVRDLKGHKRPIINQDDRKFLLESLKYVDEVIIFDESTPLLLIESIKPDIIVKGGDYTLSDVVGNHLCKVVIYDHVKGYSTTRLLQDISHR